MSAWRPEWDEAANEGGGMRGAGLGVGRVPLWTKRLLIANGLVWVLMVMLGDLGYSLTVGLAMNSDWWWTSPPFAPLWQLVSYGFLHDLGGFSHILYNSLMLFFFGSMLERAIGGRHFLNVYFGAIVMGGVLHALLGPFGPFSGLVVGASGGIMGVIVASAVLMPRASVLLIFIPLPLYVMASAMVVIDLLSMTRFGGGVAHHVHLAGALVGYLYVKKGLHRRELASPVEAVQRLRSESQERSRATDEARLDELLERINKRGLQSLSSAEKAFLNKMSKRS